MTRAAMLLFISLVAVNTGCTQITGHIYTADDWPDARSKLGRVGIVYHLLWEGEAGIREITDATRSAFGKLPHTEIVDSDVLAGELNNTDLGTRLSDYDLVFAARKLNIDTVCALTMNSYITEAMLGWQLVPPVPVWEQSNRLAYDLRVLDVASGKLLVKAHRNRTTPGISLYRLHETLPAELAEDLAIVLSSGSEKGDITDY